MTFQIRIDTDNDAFTPEPGPEVARILRDIADQVEAAGLPGTAHFEMIRDINGNTVGRFARLKTGHA